MLGGKENQEKKNRNKQNKTNKGLISLELLNLVNDLTSWCRSDTLKLGQWAHAQSD